ncbi:UDP-2,4-diacetamido-2,4,6-trideoxy-beta-L-altropyranose hydrolase [Paenibacillus anaericanus]|uniref:UDP-2,4-diacetamido-2,4, 6-trideoxy-beta-L-altropyranose hydrolase n=1 Tax=Paenibacillus anaericanus TaxID=170367 RepID=UPI002787B580|nr:UDP-2,4-diacetamido-2,4,6-trideoxy-beta-L-altropyranose hydrolase [Paenibacillus anaericanus]MDQ0089898.1 UDP-2,4-diacetamido-2,4,6-trideoxy-beta-L-altropyranose hydrolase [Paenibacillus anaericanus]
MKYFVRADASEKIGTGHIMRCLALSARLIQHKQEVIFICRSIIPVLHNLIKEYGCSVLLIEPEISDEDSFEIQYEIDLINQNYLVTDQDWLIVDHYSIHYKDECVYRSAFNNILVIDDLADRPHDCDILLDTSLNSKDRYNELVPESCIQLLGPQYALLRQEFADARDDIVDRCNKKVQRIFVCFGGTDPTNETLKTIRALEPTLNEFELKVILGKSNSHLQELMELYGNNNRIEFKIQPSSIALEMMSADLAICSGGTITWERYCMGLPAIVITIADNQLDIARQGHLLGIDEYIGSSEFVKEENILQALNSVVSRISWKQEAAQRAMNIVDGKGVSRIIQYLF